MAKRVVKKKKLKVGNFLIVLFFMIGLFFAVYLFLQIPIQNILVLNTEYLNDDDILELAGVKDYPKFLLLSSKSIEKKILKSPYINKVKVHKKWNFVLEIKVYENKVLFFDMNNNKYIFSDSSGVANNDLYDFRVPRLLNYVPGKKYQKFVYGMSKVKKNTLSKISDIEYQPNDYDKDRFLLYMDDGNMVYLTLTKFKMINHYNEVLKQLDNHKGILYLDNGNHFQIKE